MNVLITGATSSIGRLIIPELLAKGYRITTVTRKREQIDYLAGTTVLHADITELTGESVKNIDCIIHIAAATSTSNTGESSYYKTNVEGTKNLLTIGEKNGVKHFIYISSIVVLFEDHNDPYSRSKKEAEQLVKASSLNWTLLRPAEIIGADQSLSNMKAVLSTRKYVFVPGDGRQYRHPVYFKDVADAITKTILLPVTYGKSYSLAAKKPVTYFEYLKILRRINGFTFRIIRIPDFILRAAFTFRFLFPGKVKRKLNNSVNMSKSIRFDISDAVNDFGFNPAEVETAFREVVKESN